MKRLSLLLLIFLSSCGLITVEVRERQETKQTKPAQSKKQEQTTPSLKEDWKELEGIILPELKEGKPKATEKPQITMPVKGQPSRSDRGFYIKTSCGEFFRSVSDGKVLYAGNDLKNYNWVVMVESDGFVYVYAKAGSSLVKKGERVAKGQTLGKVGQNPEGCGILFEVRNTEGKPVDFELLR